MMDFFEKAAAEASEATKRSVRHAFDIADRIHALLQEQGKSQKDLAKLLGKRESEISKWLTGQHNFTIKTIATIEAALGEDLLIITSETNRRIANFYPIGEDFEPSVAADIRIEFQSGPKASNPPKTKGKSKGK